MEDMEVFDCTIDFGGVRQKAYADDKYSAERAIEGDLEHYRDEDILRDVNMSVTCEATGRTGTPDEKFDHEYDGAWVQR